MCIIKSEAAELCQRQTRYSSISDHVSNNFISKTDLKGRESESRLPLGGGRLRRFTAQPLRGCVLSPLTQALWELLGSECTHTSEVS